MTNPAGLHPVKTPVRLLYIEDDELDRRAFLRMVREKNLPYDLSTAETLAEARAHLTRSCFDVIVADYHLPDGHSTELFDQIQDIPWILLTGTLEEQLALRTLERGTDDYLTKDPQQRHLEAVPSLIEKTLYRQFLRQREQQLTRELRESEQFRRLALAAGELGTWDWNPATGEVLWDDRCFAILGVAPGPYSASQVIKELIHPPDAPLVDAAVKRALDPASDGKYEIEYRVVWPDRSVHWVAARGQALFQGEGENRKAARFIGTVMDITQRKESEAEIIALRDRLAADLAGMKRLHELSIRFVSQGDLQSLLDAILDAALAITGAQKGHVQLLNLASGVLGITGQRGFDSAFVEYFSHIRPGVVACGTAMQTRRCVVVEDATLSHLFLAEPRALELVLAAGMRAVICTPLLTRAGQLLGVLSILFAAPHRPSERDLRLLDLLARQAADFIERTQAEEAEARLAAIVKWSEDAILSKSLEGTIRTWNAGAERMFGYRAEEVIGRPVTLLIPPERIDEENRVLEQLERGQPTEHYETVRLTKDGRRLNVLLTISPVKDSQGRIIGASKIVRDIGELVRARQVLAQSKEELERLVDERTAKLQETVAELEHFSYTITHDMRAPLRALQGFAGILTEECSQCLSGARRDYLRRIATSADRMDRLIADALQYSGALRQHPELEPVDADALLRGILESYPNLQPPHANIRIDNHLPVVLGDKTGMTQCFSNLLGNAVKFVHPGKTPEVRVWAETRQLSTPNHQPSTSSVRIWFEDKGIGIEKQYHDKIWEMFQQLNKSYEGTGIGLALVRKVVARMGGNVGVESEAGQGSRFWVEFKAAEVKPQPTALPQAA